MNAVLASALVFTQIPFVAAALYNQVISTNHGSVQGYAAFSSSPAGNITNWEFITVWKGVPFAADTSGENRFKPPQPAANWTETLDASSFGPICPSTLITTDSYTVSEDCLSLNIWSNANSTDAKLPVMIWSTPAVSTAADALFDGAGMASKGVVFVNYNYRTGAFGWLATPELNSEMNELVGHNSSGNWGMLDQFAALKWVRANIAAFGGDPDMITMAGQSAGSAAVYHSVNSPLTKGLIKHAIAESGIRSPYDPLCSTLAENYRNLTYATSQGTAFLASLNISNIADARAASMADLTTTFRSSWSFGAVLDYYAMPSTYEYELVHGPSNDVPLITGNTKDESGASATTNITVAQYITDLQTQYGDTFATEFLKLYPAANDSQADMSFNAHYRDTSRVSSWLYANGWEKSASSSIYTYYWDHAPPGQNQGAYHESEINYVLNNLYGTDLPWEAVDFTIARKMSSYWANFVKTGNPNKGGSYHKYGELIHWSPSKSTKNETMHLGDGFGNVPIASPEQVALINDYFSTQTPY